jgi:hypothetical protein
MDEIKRSLKDRPFTGSQKNESKFLKTLTDKQRDTYKAAKEQRQKQREAFAQMLKDHQQ